MITVLYIVGLAGLLYLSLGVGILLGTVIEFISEAFKRYFNR